MGRPDRRFVIPPVACASSLYALAFAACGRGSVGPTIPSTQRTHPHGHTRRDHATIVLAMIV